MSPFISPEETKHGPMAQGALSQGHSLRLALRGCCCARLRAAQQPRNPRAAPAVTFSTRSHRSKAGAA